MPALHLKYLPSCKTVSQKGIKTLTDQWGSPEHHSLWHKFCKYHLWGHCYWQQSRNEQDLNCQAETFLSLMISGMVSWLQVWVKMDLGGTCPFSLSAWIFGRISSYSLQPWGEGISGDSCPLSLPAWGSRDVGSSSHLRTEWNLGQLAIKTVPQSPQCRRNQIPCQVLPGQGTFWATLVP